MDLLQVISQAEKKYGSDEQGFYTDITLSILQSEHVFSLLECGPEIIRGLTTGIKNIHSSTQLGFTRVRDMATLTLSKKLAQLCKKQQHILSCPNVDEHVVLLACLKGLEKTYPLYYKSVLKETLTKQLHKVSQTENAPTLIGRKKELSIIRQALLRSERNNIIIIGPSGVGKTTLAQSVGALFPDKKVVRLFAGTDIFFDQVVTVLSEEEGNVLFFLDEIPSFEISQLQYLLENGHMIATANDTAFKKIAADNPHIVNRCEVIDLDEPAQEDLQNILLRKSQELIKKYEIQLEDGSLEEIEQLARQYLFGIAFPAKGLSLLEEAFLTASTQHTPMVTKEGIRIAVSQKTNIPISSLTDFQKKDLAKLGEKLTEKVKGQEEAVQKVAGTIQRARLGFKKPNKPIGSFLFVGPSGVGKTELAKALAGQVFGDEEAMVRLDMSEFAEAHMVQRLIGSPPGYIGFEEGGQLTNPVKAKPYTLILLDEIEKAHPRVFDIFLQVLDDGRLTDGQGKKVDFRNTLIVATSNAGTEDMLDMIAEKKSHEEIETEIKDILSDYFRVEFLNRFDGLIVFKPLTMEALIAIADIQIHKLQTELQKRTITLTVSRETVQRLAKESYDPKYGARGLLRLLQDTIENKLAEMILDGRLKEKQTVAF